MATLHVKQRADGRFAFTVEVGQGFVYETDPAATEELARQAAERWLFWWNNVSSGKAESVYYILHVPETWPPPPLDAHPFVGLRMKIGRTNDVLKRLQNLRTGAAGEMIVMAIEPGNAEIEKARHTQFAAERRSGEWFVCTPALVRHAFATWRRNNLLPPEHQRRMLRLGDRIRDYRAVRHALGGPPNMVNPSLNEDWADNTFIDLFYTDILRKGGFYKR